MILFTAPLLFWSGDGSGSHYILVPEEQSAVLRAHAIVNRRGFGSVKVEARIGEVKWRTSAFPQKGGGYFLPVKIDVCRQAGIAAGDDIEVRLELL